MTTQTGTPMRRSVLTGESLPAASMIRLVQGPDGQMVPDLAAKLPGRGVWLAADGAALRRAMAGGKLAPAVARSLKTAVPVSAFPADLPDRLAALLRRRVLDRLGLMRRSGHLVTGYDKIATQVNKTVPAAARLWLTASDGAEDGRRKMRARLGPDLPGRVAFDRESLSTALGRENVVHILLLDGGGIENVEVDLERLDGICEQPVVRV